MNTILLISGILIILILMWDAFQTIVHINGGGFFSKNISWGIWNSMFYLSGANSKSKLLDFAGPVILVSIIFIWVFGLWMGFSLLYLSDPDSVVDTATGAPANIVGKIYFVGYTITSLGNGDLKAGSDAWRIVTNLMGINSLLIITLAISYFIPVLQSVVDKRSLAAFIYNMGENPQQMLQNGWNGKDFSPIYPRLQSLEKLIIKNSERHLAYPVLHFFHSTEKRYAPPVGLAILMEVIIIQKVFKIDRPDNDLFWDSLYKVMDGYLNILGKTFVDPAQESPPFNYIQFLRERNLISNTEDFEERLKEFDENRRKLKTLITKDGWKWKDITG